MQEEHQSVLDKIGYHYYSFTASEQKVADYMLARQHRMDYLSISELADACGVATATISRFCRRLGYSGYPAFKLALVNAAARHTLSQDDNPLSGEVSEADSIGDVCRKLLNAEIEAMTQTMEVLDEDAVRSAATLLEHAPRVLCMGQGGSMLIASEAAHLFSTVSNHFFAVSDSHMQAIAAAMMDPEDVIFFFSYSGSTRAMMETLTQARQRQGKVLLVTRFPNSPGAQLSDVVLQCGANENPVQSGSIPARIAQMYLLDVLFSEFCRRNMAQATENRARIARVLVDKHL